MQFDAQDYPYASKRHVVYARNGMVCAGNPTATAAGLKTLLKGGNAVDAAVTVASTLPVVEPTGNGLGADCFAIIWYKGKMYGMAEFVAISTEICSPRYDDVDMYIEQFQKDLDSIIGYYEESAKTALPTDFIQ